MEKQLGLLEDLSRTLGLDLSFDEQGQCLLMLDEHLLVSIKTADGAFVLYGMVGDCQPDMPNDVIRRMLALNLLLNEENAGSLALDDATDALMLIKHVPTQALSAQDFEAVLQRFVNQLDTLIGLTQA